MILTPDQQRKRDECYKEGMKRAKTFIRTKYKWTARKEDIEDAVQDAMLYICQKDAIAYPDPNLPLGKWYAMVCYISWQRYVNHMKKEALQRDIRVPHDDELGDLDWEILEDATEFEQELEKLDDKHPEYKRRARKKFVEEWRKHLESM